MVELITVYNLETSLTVFLGKVSSDTILGQSNWCYLYDRLDLYSCNGVISFYGK